MSKKDKSSKNKNAYRPKAKDFKSTLKRLGRDLWAYKLGVSLTVIFAVFGATFAVIGPKLMGKAVTSLFEGQVSGNMDFNQLWYYCVTLAILYFFSTVFSYLQSFVIAGVTQKMSYKYREDISKKINKIPLNYFDSQTHGEVLSRVTNDVTTLSTGLNDSLTQIVSSIVLLVGITAMMLSISVIMTIASLITVVFSMLSIQIVVKYSQKYYRTQQQYLGKINSEVEEVFSGHNIVKAFNGEERSLEKFTGYNEELYDSAWKAQFFGGIMMPLIKAISNIGYVIISVLGTIFVAKKRIEVGDILAFIQYFRQFNSPLSQIAQVSNLMQSTTAAAERVFEFLDEAEEKPDVQNTKSIDNINGSVSFKNVTFGYNPDKIIINDFSAEIAQGKKVAIVGPTGAGKTTIVKLLMRFYDINSGEILIDGNNIQDFKRNDLRELFGMVLQDTWLFNGTLRENLKYGNLDATEEQMLQASKDAHADDFIKKLPDGYDMVINEEADNISQGQKQLLTIARAILANPKILILDEATSSVDTRTEILIQNAMENLMKNRTSFIIAHRLSTIKNADLILVMENGNIVEQGSHEELLAKQGVFYKLHQSQFEGQDE